MDHKVYHDNGVYKCDSCGLAVEIVDGRFKYIERGEPGIMHKYGVFASVRIGKPNIFRDFVDSIRGDG